MFCVACLANLCNNLSYILYGKFLICFALLFLANLSNNLSYILYRKFSICFALLFLANLCNSLSSILYREFPIYFVSVFSASLNHIFGLYICIENILQIKLMSKFQKELNVQKVRAVDK